MQREEIVLIVARLIALVENQLEITWPVVREHFAEASWIGDDSSGQVEGDRTLGCSELK